MLQTGPEGARSSLAWWRFFLARHLPPRILWIFQFFPPDASAAEAPSASHLPSRNRSSSPLHPFPWSSPKFVWCVRILPRSSIVGCGQVGGDAHIDHADIGSSSERETFPHSYTTPNETPPSSGHQLCGAHHRSQTQCAEHLSTFLHFSFLPLSSAPAPPLSGIPYECPPFQQALLRRWCSLRIH